MKKTNLILLLCSLFFLQSCFDVREEMWLEKNGSGRYSLSLDFKSLKHLVTFVRMANLMRQGDVLDLEKLPKVDRSFRMAELPDSTKKKFSSADLLSKISGAVQMDARRKKFRARFDLHFSKTDEVAKFYQILEDFSKRSGKTIDAEGIAGAMLLKNRPAFSFSSGQFERKAGGSKASGFLQELIGGNEILEKVIGRADYEMIYHMPSKVKSISNAGFKKRCKKIKRVVPLTALGKADLNFSARLK